MEIVHFTPWSALAGGALIGLGAPVFVFVAMLLLGMFAADKLVAFAHRGAARPEELASEANYPVGGALE